MRGSIENTVLDDWIAIAENFKSSIDKMLNEVHVAKMELMLLQNEIIDRLDAGQYIRDDQRIIISAPEIIIGNVNRQGILQEGGKIIIRGSETLLHGVGDEGTVKVAAPIIEQKAVDPGIDGEEEVVGNVSKIISTARNIAIDSQDPVSVEDRGAVFADTDCGNGITFHSNSDILVDSTKRNKTKKEEIEKRQKAVDERISDCETQSDNTFKQMKDTMESIKKKMTENKILSKTKDLSRANFAAIDMLSAAYEDDMTTYGTLLSNYSMMISKLAELKRQKACLKEELNTVVSDEDFKKDSTNTSIKLLSEQILVRSMDGENKVRTNQEAGIKLQGNDISVLSTDEKDALTPEKSAGRVTIRSRNIVLSTDDFVDPKYEEGVLKSAKSPLVGNITIKTKDLDVNAVDLDVEDSKVKESSLTKDSCVNIRAEKVKIKTIDEKGKSIGKFSVNSQKISLKSTDIKDYKTELEVDDQNNIKHPEKMSSDKVAADSEMLLLAESIKIGRKKKEFISKKIRIGADESIAVFSNKKLNAYIGEDGAFDSGLSVSDKKVNLASSSETTISGEKVKVEGETTFNSKVTGTDIECKNLTASSAIKAPNISDGQVISGAAGSKTKITAEEVEDSSL